MNLEVEDRIAELIMTRTGSRETMLLVEGESDSLCFQRFVDLDKCCILPMGGKGNALDVLEGIKKEGVKGVLAIVDADFWHIDKNGPQSKDVLPTDCHDLELMIIKSKSFKSWYDSFASKGKTKTFLDKHGCNDIKELLLLLCRPIGMLRWVSAKNDLQLAFQKDGAELNLKNIIHKTLLTVDESKLVRNVLNLTTGVNHSYVAIKKMLCKALKEKNFNLFQICRGHDVTTLISIGLTKVIGSKSRQIASRENIEKALILAYDSQDFQKTRLYKQVKRWEVVNAGFTVL